MKAGDIIKTYYKGYFILDRIERRYVTEEMKKYSSYKDKEVGEEYSPLFHFTQIFDENFNKRTTKKCCDARFCSLASESIKEELKELREKQKKLKEFLETLKK